MEGSIVAVACSSAHLFSKTVVPAITLLAGLGVEGDAHLGATVKHRSRVAIDPAQPNLRQVHLIQAELFEELRGRGFDVPPGAMGENITTRAIPLLDLPRGTRLRLGGRAVVEITGLRNPCAQLDRYQNGLMRAVLDRGAAGELIRKAGVMGVVVNSGRVATGDDVVVEIPPPPHCRLEPV